MKQNIIIVAGGKGSRMKSIVPKQFLLLHKKPILMHTIERFYKYNKKIKIIVVLPKNQVKQWNKLCKKYSFKIKHKIAVGGKTRYESVKNGLSLTDSNCLIGIHDGVRPLVSLSTIDKCYKTAKTKGNAIPIIDIVDSVRQLNSKGSKAIDRAKYKLVQTPQVFKSQIINKAYNLPFDEKFTDDASVVESAMYKINIEQGNRENIKITTPYDLIIANALIKGGDIR